MNFLNKQQRNKIKSTLKHLFYLPPADRKVLFVFSAVLLIVTLVILCSIEMLSTHPYARKLTAEEKEQYISWCSQNDKKQVHKKRFAKAKGGAAGYYAVPKQEWATFTFDPNTADSTQLLALGFAPWQVRNIYKYRAKGGRYRTKEDVKRIYGMTGELLNHVYPLIHIAPEFQYLKPQKKDSIKQESFYAEEDKIQKFKEKVLVNANTADTALLKRIPGIGSGFARRIVRYRQQLGGFVSVAQLKEIPHFPDSLLAWFVVHDTSGKQQYVAVGVRTIKINQATLEQLCKHPYLNFYQARVIVEHRRKYGNLRSLNDLSLYEEFTEKDLKRLKPYCDF